MPSIYLLRVHHQKYDIECYKVGSADNLGARLACYTRPSHQSLLIEVIDTKYILSREQAYHVEDQILKATESFNLNPTPMNTCEYRTIDNSVVEMFKRYTKPFESFDPKELYKITGFFIEVGHGNNTKS